MIAINLPALPAGTWRAVFVERHEIAGREMYAVTIRSRGGTTPIREWFADADRAYAYGLSQADDRALPFFDLSARDGGAAG